MEAIFIENEIYLAVRNDEGCDVDEPSLVFDIYDKSKTNLFGGRVMLDGHMWSSSTGIELFVDGIEILKFDSDLNTTPYLDLEMVTAYLNQIRQLGIDSFLENYKRCLLEMKTELQKEANVLRQDLAINNNENQQKLLEKIQALVIGVILPLLFLLSVNMNAGLDNYKYQEAYDAIVNKLSL